jgi:anti-sigma regulatory factor (Ser/Thr protein kinase)
MTPSGTRSGLAGVYSSWGQVVSRDTTLGASPVARLQSWGRLQLLPRRKFRQMQGSEETIRAIPIGLIVNELVTNALKYAFPSQAKGLVKVTLKRVADELRLTVADDGQGIEPRRADSGLSGRLAEGFAQQLGAGWRGRATSWAQPSGSSCRPKVILRPHDHNSGASVCG